jgi:hypothetical protein
MPKKSSSDDAEMSKFRIGLLTWVFEGLVFRGNVSSFITGELVEQMRLSNPRQWRKFVKEVNRGLHPSRRSEHPDVLPKQCHVLEYLKEYFDKEWKKLGPHPYVEPFEYPP